MGFKTLEVRWFFAGSLEDDAGDVVAWFRERVQFPVAGAPAPLEWPSRWRNDVYLVLAGALDLGIKWRDDPYSGEEGGRLELKGLASAETEEGFGPQARGYLGRWIKWSYTEGVVPSQVRQLFGVEGGPQRVVVSKSRLMRRFSLERPGAVLEVPSHGDAPLPDRGLGLELTRIRAGQETFWTLGFEGYPDDPELRIGFQSHVTALLDGFPGSSLRTDDSASYPRWLQRFV